MKTRPAFACNLKSPEKRAPHGRLEIVVLLILMLVLQSCTAKETEIPATAESNAKQESPIPLITDTSPAVTNTAEPTITPEPTTIPELTVSPTTEVLISDPTKAHLIKDGAAYGFLEPYEIDEVVTGDYQPDYPECGNGWLASLPEEDGEIILTLSYRIPVLPDQIEIYTGEMPINIRRVELLNSYSGLGVNLDLSTTGSWEGNTEGVCAQRLVLPTNTDFEVDTVVIEFGDMASVVKVAAVEMAGRLAALVEPPVYWRVSLPSTPVDIAMGQNGVVYVATRPNGLYVYDIEGNQLNQFSVPSEAKLTSVEADLFGNLIVTDATYGWFIVISPTGEHLVIGGDSSFSRMAVNPQDGNLYLLSDNTILVYTTDTAELIRSIPLDELHQNTSLAFNPQGQLYLLRDYEWDATLVVMDPLTGEELDSIPLDNSEINEIVVRDIAIDEAGNIYVLYIVNTARIAVHKIDPQGTLLQRFGLLSGDPGEWPEGTFLDPYGITVSPDGRFILIADGYDDHSYLTAFLMEIDE